MKRFRPPRRIRRNGHIGFLFELAALSAAVVIVMSIIGVCVWGADNPPKWFGILTIALMPMTWFFGVGLAITAVIFGVGGPFVVVVRSLIAIEEQASKVGLAVWQFERARVAGIPIGLWKRVAVVSAATAITVTTSVCMFGSWSKAIDGTSTTQVALFTLLAMASAVCVTLTAARTSLVPAQRVFARARA